MSANLALFAGLIRFLPLESRIANFVFQLDLTSTCFFTSFKVNLRQKIIELVLLQELALKLQLLILSWVERLELLGQQLWLKLLRILQLTLILQLESQALPAQLVE
jgi:hypothetical protein